MISLKLLKNSNRLIEIRIVNSEISLNKSIFNSLKFSNLIIELMASPKRTEERTCSS